MTNRLHLGLDRDELAAVLVDANRRAADYAIVVDLIGSLTRIGTEAEAIEQIFDVFTALFAPARLSYVSWLDGRPGRSRSRPPLLSEPESVTFHLSDGPGDAIWTEAGTGFSLRIGHQGKVLGALEIDGVAFPEYREHYLNLALAVSGACGLAISNARKYEEIKRIEQFREEYLHTVGHDLRNPLTNISGTAQWLQRSLTRQGLEREAQRAESILMSARRMNGMVQDLVESARLESGKLELRKQPIDLLGLVVEIVDRTGTPEDRQRIHVEAPEPVPPILADPQYLERAIVNLLTNGLKYSPADKSVVLQIAQGNRQVELAVTDEGAGIPADELPRLFARYYRVKHGQGAEGLGLGLYITRLIVEAHGGRVGAASEVGKGSTFRFTLPLATGYEC